MALRVLLADESTTIKKVMQLALQDFAVEVKAVHVGVDVVEVAKAFQPDIIFADVLLQKKNGYEVCRDLKREKLFAQIPVVLMWSSFLDIDEKQASLCGANQRLEKPFDVETLRQIILELVPKTRTQRLAHFLKFPDQFVQPLQAEEEKKRELASRSAVEPAPAPKAPTPSEKLVPKTTPEPTRAAPVRPTPATTPAPAAPERPRAPEAAASSGWNMDSFDNIEDFESDFSSESEGSGTAPSDSSASDLARAAHQGQGPTASRRPFSTVSTEAAAPREPEELSFDQDENADIANEDAFSEMNLSQLGSAKAPTARPSDDQEPWSHQDLSAFKIDLSPIPVEGEDFALTFDLSEKELAGTEFMQTTPDDSMRSEHDENPDLPAPIEHEFEVSEDYSLELDDPLAEVHVADLAKHLTKTPRQELWHPEPLQETETSNQGEAPPQTRSSKQTKTTHQDGVAIGTAQLTAQQLETIIRAQSREIIEAVVGRLVPEIATELIQQELRRLLDEDGPGDATAKAQKYRAGQLQNDPDDRQKRSR